MIDEGSDRVANLIQSSDCTIGTDPGVLKGREERSGRDAGSAGKEILRVALYAELVLYFVPEKCPHRAAPSLSMDLFET